MDFKFTPEQEALKSEFDTFFREEEKNAPEGWVGGMEDRWESDDGWAYHLATAKKMAERGWLSLAWPKEYDGRELGIIEQALFSESASYHRVPGIDFMGSQILAPALLALGTEEQKREWLPKIANAESQWCQGWSEPNAGSDLAALTTRAVEDGDEFVINGQKIWTTAAHRADHIFILARTDPEIPRHKGLTFFLSEMDRPGITVRPLHYMNGAHVYNEVFLDDLRVPKKNIVGQLNQGWYATMAGANFERSGCAVLAEGRRDLEDLVQFCKETLVRGKLLANDPTVRRKLSDRAIELEAARQWSYYCAFKQSQNPMTIAEPSAAKYYSTELIVRLANTAIEVMGLYGTLKRGSRWAPLHGKFESMCQLYLGVTIAAGSTEIQKNLIAWLELQLPRS